MDRPADAEQAPLLAELNDLLQLDCDAVASYTVAINCLRTALHRETLLRFRADHENHIEALSDQIRQRGGTPLRMPHIPTGPIKLWVQALGLGGGDRTVVMMFAANELQARDKYARHAGRSHPQPLQGIIERAAADEQRHYDWACETLESFGIGADTLTGNAVTVMSRLHATTADMIEEVERMTMEVLSGTALMGLPWMMQFPMQWPTPLPLPELPATTGKSTPRAPQERRAAVA